MKKLKQKHPSYQVIPGHHIHFKPSELTFNLREIFEAQPVVPENKPSSGRTKFVPEPMSHAEINQCIHDKIFRVLAFLADGEIWSSVKVLSHLLRLGEGQTQATIRKMVRDKLLKTEKLIDGRRIYGIAPAGAAYLNSDQPCRIFSLGKTKPTIVDHHLLSQIVRIEMERAYGAKDWIAGKILFRKKFYTNIPDGVFFIKYKKIAVEIELTRKYETFKAILNNYCNDLGPVNDPEAGLHQVIYFSPHDDFVRRKINEFVPKEFRDQFFVCPLNTRIDPHRHDEITFDNNELNNFLNLFD